MNNIPGQIWFYLRYPLPKVLVWWAFPARWLLWSGLYKITNYTKTKSWLFSPWTFLLSKTMFEWGWLWGAPLWLSLSLEHDMTSKKVKRKMAEQNLGMTSSHFSLTFFFFFFFASCNRLSQRGAGHSLEWGLKRRSLDWIKWPSHHQSLSHLLLVK